MHGTIKLKYVCRILDEFRRPISAEKRNQNSDTLYDYYGASGAIDKIDGYTIDDHVMLIGEDGANLVLRNLPLMYEVNGKAWINNHAHILKPIENVDFDYLFFALENADIFPFVTGSAQPKLNQENLKLIPVPITDYLTQKRIAAFVKSKSIKIDSLVSDIQKQIDTLEEYKRSVITEAVTKGLDRDVEMRDSGVQWIGEIPKHWSVMPNKYVMHKVKNICPKYNGEDLLSLTMNGVIIRNLDAGGKMPTSFDGYQYIEPNNLLMCLFDIDVTPRCVGLIKNYGLTSPAYSQFIMNDTAYAPYYNYYYTMIDNEKTLLHLAKNLRHSLTEDQLGSIAVIVPPISEQERIASYLDNKCQNIDLVIADKQKQIETIEEYKKSLIFEYVTGKKEVV